MDSDDDDVSIEFIESEDFEDEWYEYDCVRGGGGGLESRLDFDSAALEEIILRICDKFGLRIVLDIGEAKTALVKSGFSIVSEIIGRKSTNAKMIWVTTAGGFCALGINNAAMSMRKMWNNIKGLMDQLYELVFNFLNALGINNYSDAALLLTSDQAHGELLARLIITTASRILHKRVVSMPDLRRCAL